MENFAALDDIDSLSYVYSSGEPSTHHLSSYIPTLPIEGLKLLSENSNYTYIPLYFYIFHYILLYLHIFKFIFYRPRKIGLMFVLSETLLNVLARTRRFSGKKQISAGNFHGS